LLTVDQKLELGLDHIWNPNKKEENARQNPKRLKSGDEGYIDSARKRANDRRLTDAEAVAFGVRNENGAPCVVPGCGKINYDRPKLGLHVRSDVERDPEGAAHQYLNGCCTRCCIPRASECLDYDVIAQNFGVAVADGFVNAHAVKDLTTRNLFHYVASTQELSGEDVQELRLLVEHTYYTSIVAPAAAADVRLFGRRVESGANYSEEVLRALHDVADRIEADWATTAPGASQSNGVALASHFYDQVLGHIDAQCARGVVATGTARRLKDAVENFRQGAEPNGTVYPGKLERLLIRVAEGAGDGERIVATAFTANVGESTSDSLRVRGRKQLVLPKEFATFLEDSTNVMPFDETGVLFYDPEGVQTVHAVYQTTESDRRKLAVVGSEAFDCKVVLGLDTRPSLGGGHENDQVLAEWWASLDDPNTVLEQLALLNSATARVSTTDDGKLLSVHCHVLFYAAASPTGTNPDAPSLLRNTVLRSFEATGVANMAWVTVRWHCPDNGASAALARLDTCQALCATLSVLHSFSAQTLNRCHCRTAFANCISCDRSGHLHGLRLASGQPTCRALRRWPPPAAAHLRGARSRPQGTVRPLVVRHLHQANGPGVQGARSGGQAPPVRHQAVALAPRV
jgi:hypothetical protein